MKCAVWYCVSPVYRRCVSTEGPIVNGLQLPKAVAEYCARRVDTWLLEHKQAARKEAEQFQEKLLLAIRVKGVMLPNEVIDLILTYADNQYWLAEVGMC